MCSCTTLNATLPSRISLEAQKQHWSQGLLGPQRDLSSKIWKARASIGMQVRRRSYAADPVHADEAASERIESSAGISSRAVRLQATTLQSDMGVPKGRP